MLGKSLRNYIVIAVVICFLGASALAKDYVVVKGSGNAENITYSSARITDFTKTQIVFDAEDEDGKVSSYKVNWKDVVSYSIDPELDKSLAFKTGFKAMNDTDFKTAISEFEKVINSKDVTTIEKHLAYRYVIYCGSVGNDRNNSGYAIIEKYAPKFKDDYPNSYFLKEAYDTWGRVLLSQNKRADAKRVFEDLKNYSPALSEMRLAIMVYMTGDFEKAVPMFQKAVSLADDDKFTKDFSNVLLAYCYQQLQKWSNAKEILEKLTGEGDESSNTGDILGKAYLYLSIEYGRNQEYYKSFLAAMKAYTVYKDNLTDGEEKDALAYALICAQELSKDEEKWVKRAQTIEATYKDTYGTAFDKRKMEFPK